MPKFKKLLALLLTVLLLSFSACAKNETPADNSTPTENSVVSQAEKDYQPTVKPDGSITLKPSQASDSSSSATASEKENHIDENNDGKCDKCKESVLVYIDLFAVNDLHGKFIDSSTQPGVDELSTYFKNAYKNEDNVVVLSSGDMWQGTAESGLTNGKIMTEWMNYIGFEAMTVGNHEYDWGADDIEANIKIADFPLLAINIYSRNDNERVDYYKSSVLIERDGVKIGIIGAVGDCYSSISADMTSDIYFKTGKELTELVKNESIKLRAQGAQIIIYSLHDGYDRSSSGKGMIADNQLEGYYDSVLSSGDYVDIVFEAHSHQNYVLKDAYGIYHMQGGGENKGISHAEIAFNTVNENHIVTKAEYVQNSIYEVLEEDKIVDDLLDKYKTELAITKKVLGKNGSHLESRDICNLVARLYYEKGVQKWGSKYNIALGGGYLNTRSPYELPAGDVTYSMLYSLLTFDNQLVLCSIKGSDLKNKFLTKSKYYIYPNKSQSDFDSNKTYYVIVDSYTSTYRYNNLTEIERYDDNVYARDLLAEYISAGNLK